MSDYTPTTGHVRARYVRDDANFLTDWAEFDRWLAGVKAEAIQEAIAYLKTTPAVTLVGKGGAYELLEAHARAYREGEK